MLAGASQAGLLNPDPGGAGGSWDQAGTGETISYACYTYAASGSAAPCGSGAGINTIEDTFTRANQTGWGSSTNSDGVPNVAWGMDGSGSLSNVTISNNTGSYGYPGATNVVGIASAGGTAYNGGDALVEFTVSAVGHATPYVVENVCPDKSCYYGARLHTSQNLLEIAERAGGSTNILASVPFTPSPSTLYWMRLDVSIVPGGFSEHTLASSAQDPWGTAVDSSGNVWFAAAGCDFGQNCSSTTPPGQIGEIVATTQAINFYTLPNLSGNQPCFVALDGSGNVWFTTPNNAMIGEFNPSTHTFVGQWSVTSGSGPWDLTVSNGKIWYTEHYVSAVGEFDPSTNTYSDFQTPTGNSNPYGIVANDPVNANLIWFTENNGSVARIAVLDTGNNNAISEYLIRSQLPGSNLTPHLIALDTQGDPWWTEGWTRDIGKLIPLQATAGQCGTTSGDCLGVTEYALPNAGSCSSSHVSGIAVQGTQFVWLDDSLAAQVASFDPTAQQFTMYDLTNCGAHPHDGLNLDASTNVWWDEEFANDLGELTH
jgi:streptogramin lyase